jgi:hypothetical protein
MQRNRNPQQKGAQQGSAKPSAAPHRGGDCHG